MRDDYKLKGPTQKVDIELESDVAKRLEEMERYCKHSRSELTNTALKRFISQHRDFLPPNKPKSG